MNENSSDEFKRGLFTYLSLVHEGNNKECQRGNIRQYCQYNNLLNYLEYSWTVDGLSEKGLMELNRLKREMIINEVLRDD